MFRTLTIFISLIIFSQFAIKVTAQSNTLKCGDIVEGEFTEDYQDRSFNIHLNHGDTLYVEGRSLERAGLLSFVIIIENPEGDVNLRDTQNLGVSDSPSSEIELSTYTGMYKIFAINSDLEWDYLWGGWKRPTRSGIGVFELYISCTLRDGTEVRAGSKPSPTETLEDPATQALPVSGLLGFPPIDFESVSRSRLEFGEIIEGEISPRGDSILGYRFDADEDDVLKLSFERTRGNLNLGLVTLSEENEVLYLVALVTSETMETSLIIPAGGEYTIGLFRIDLMPPSSPQRTEFEILVEKSR